MKRLLFAALALLVAMASAAGKLADLVILDRDPLKVEATAIREIKVVETIKEGRTVYPAP